MSEETQELKETLERSLQNPSLIDREKTERFYKGIINLQQKVEQLENIRKEAIEYIDGHTFYYTDTPYDLLDILKKGDNNGK